MKIILENGGLDVSLYGHTKREDNETNQHFEYRVDHAKRKRCNDLLFLNEIFDIIHSAIDYEDLRDAMHVLWKSSSKGETTRLKYNFGTDTDDLDDINFMEVWQADNSNRLLYVELQS